MASVAWEQAEVEAANATGKQPVVFVHGLWLLASSWRQWRDRFEEEAGPDGALHLGSPETVAQKIASTVSALGIDRFDLKYSAGTLPHPAIMRNIELYGTQVIPRVRELLG